MPDESEQRIEGGTDELFNLLGAYDDIVRVETENAANGATSRVSGMKEDLAKRIFYLSGIEL